ncbi:MAG: hypothetical protein ABWY10_00240 [Tardiphaga sp.]
MTRAIDEGARLRRLFAGLHEHRVVDAGHNLPQQAPHAFADAVIKVQDWLV